MLCQNTKKQRKGQCKLQQNTCILIIPTGDATRSSGIRRHHDNYLSHREAKEGKTQKRYKKTPWQLPFIIFLYIQFFFWWVLICFLFLCFKNIGFWNALGVLYYFLVLFFANFNSFWHTKYQVAYYFFFKLSSRLC